MNATEPTELLAIVIEELQADADTAWATMNTSRMEMYKHLARVFVSYQQVSRQYEKGLNALYDAHGINFKKLSHGTNYVPYLRLVWGRDIPVSEKRYSIYGRCLSNIEKEVAANPEKYPAQTIVDKIAQFIQLSNGCTALSKMQKYRAGSDVDKAPGTQLLSEQDLKDAADAQKLAELSDVWLSNAHYSETISVPIDQHARAFIGDGLGLMLVRTVNGTMHLLGTSKNSATINEVAAKQYRSTFSSLKPEVRAIVETIRSQCMSGEHYPLQAVMQDKVTLSNGNTSTVVRRLMYVGRTKTLLLSRVGVSSGVVTMTKLRGEPLLAGSDDLVLANYSFRRTEAELIGAERHCLWSLSSVSRPEGATSAGPKVLLGLKNLVDESRLLLDFWQQESSQEPLYPQQILKQDPAPVIWTAELDTDSLRSLSAELVDPWFEHCAKYAKRKEQIVLRMKVAAESVSFEMIRRNGVWENSIQLPWLATNNLGQDKVSAKFFLAKDLMPILQSLPDYDVCGTVSLSLIYGALLVSFTTAVADYTVAIPTADDSGSRDTEAFEMIVPNQFTSFETEHGIVDDSHEGEGVED